MARLFQSTGQCPHLDSVLGQTHSADITRGLGSRHLLVGWGNSVRTMKQARDPGGMAGGLGGVAGDLGGTVGGPGGVAGARVARRGPGWHGGDPGGAVGTRVAWWGSVEEPRAHIKQAFPSRRAVWFDCVCVYVRARMRAHV